MFVSLTTALFFRSSQMSVPTYQVTAESSLRYSFLSISNAKTVQKLVIYDLLSVEFDLFNLALVDQHENGLLDDLSISNNQDMVRVLATVIQTMHLFFEIHANATVFFSGSTPSRTRLYRLAISQNILLFDETFTIKGLLNGKAESYQPNRSYEGFTIQLKQQSRENS